MTALRLLVFGLQLAVAECMTSPFSSRGYFVAAPFVGNQGWYPPWLTAETLVPMRHAELKHGRLAMLAAVGIPASEALHPLVVQGVQFFSSPKDMLVGGFCPSILNGGLSQPEVAPALAFALRTRITGSRGRILTVSKAF